MKSKLPSLFDFPSYVIYPSVIRGKSKVKQSLYTPWRRLGGEEVTEENQCFHSGWYLYFVTCVIIPRYVSFGGISDHTLVGGSIFVWYV
jgi:hypothetical protein